MIDSISSLYTALSQQQLQSRVSAAVTKQSLDIMEMQGAAVMKLLEGAEQITKAQFQDPMLGQHIDFYA